MRLRALLFLLTHVWAAPAGAVLLASGDGTGNTSAPADDPGFRSVGTLKGASAVHLGFGWVITAAHVGGGSPAFLGVSYTMVPGSLVTLRNSDGTPADLVVFRVNPIPPLLPLVIAPSAPPVGADLILVGAGRDRGAATTWSGYAGWLCAGTSRMRWGTNQLTARNLIVRDTRAMETDFSGVDATTFEAQAVLGDSGGAVFWKSPSGWTLAGILYAVGPYEGQPAGTTLFGNDSFAAQLPDYAAQIAPLAAAAVCNDGLDNDGDGRIDYGGDPGCAFPTSDTESPACNNGLDDDGDGLVDLADPDCGGDASRSFESPTPACGIGFELTVVLPALALLRGRRRRAPWRNPLAR